MSIGPEYKKKYGLIIPKSKNILISFGYWLCMSFDRIKEVRTKCISRNVRPKIVVHQKFPQTAILTIPQKLPQFYKKYDKA